MGIVFARLAADSAPGPEATITSTGMRINSPTSAGCRVWMPSADLNTTTTFLPFSHPSPRRWSTKAAKPGHEAVPRSISATENSFER
jgi:hypothetical protein